MKHISMLKNTLAFSIAVFSPFPYLTLHYLMLSISPYTTTPTTNDYIHLTSHTRAYPPKCDWHWCRLSWVLQDQNPHMWDNQHSLMLLSWQQWFSSDALNNEKHVAVFITVVETWNIGNYKESLKNCCTKAKSYYSSRIVFWIALSV